MTSAIPDTSDQFTRLLSPSPPNPADPATWVLKPMEEVQRAAAIAPEGPLVIMGGSGTGKSRTLENRALHLVRAGASPYNITLLTFNARAAQRLQTELGQAIGGNPSRTGFFIGTMHKYCATLLRQIGWQHVGITPTFSICDQEQTLTLLAEISNGANHDGPPRLKRSELNHLRFWLDLNRSLEPEQQNPPESAEWLHYAERYQQEKRRQNLLDFTDLLTLAQAALESSPPLRDTYASVRSRHLIIDEFQDLTPLQYRLVRLLTGPTQSVSVALDPNQSIYQWRGANPDLLKRFLYDYPNAELRGLSINHRTSASIMRAWRNMARHPLMTGLVDDYQTALRPGQHKPMEQCIAGPPHAQYTAIAQHIKELIDTEDYQPHEIAVLSRQRAAASRIATQLDHLAIPYTVIGEEPSQHDPNAQCITAMLNLAVNPSNAWAFNKAADCNVFKDQRHLNHVIARDVRETARQQNCHLIDAARVVKGQLNAGNAVYLQLAYAIETWEKVQELLRQPKVHLPDLIQYIHDQMFRHSTGRKQNQLAPAILRLMTVAERSEREHSELEPTQRLIAYLETLTNAQHPDEQSPANADPFQHHKGIALATIHASKGLQWPVVFIPNCTTQVIPGQQVHEGTPRMAEEQRLFYVGVTRAEDRLYTYWSQQQEDGSEAIPSPFLQTLTG